LGKRFRQVRNRGSAPSPGLLRNPTSPRAAGGITRAAPVPLFDHTGRFRADGPGWVSPPSIRSCRPKVVSATITLQIELSVSITMDIGQSIF